MGPTKRKLEDGNENARPEKKKRPRSSSAIQPTILKGEEPSFPRGGASILTPLEQRQIQIQAKQDVLFEQSTGTKAPRNEFQDEENDEDLPEQPNALVGKTNRKPRSKQKKKAKNAPVEELAVRIEGLSYKVSQHIWRKYGS